MRGKTIFLLGVGIYFPYIGLPYFVRVRRHDGKFAWGGLFEYDE